MHFEDVVTMTTWLFFFSRCGLRIRQVIADAPKRAELRGMQGHNGRYGCDYCSAPAASVPARKKDRTKIAWPKETQGGPLRTHEAFMAILENTNFEGMSNRRREGIKQKSALAYHPDIDIVHHIVAEYMHLRKDLIWMHLHLICRLS